MKKFIFKIVILSFPFLVLFSFTHLYYEPFQGDALRVGYVFNKYPSFRDKFEKEYNNPIKYSLFSESPQNLKFDILTIGDSFSEQGAAGYQNYLASDYILKILHFDSEFHLNPIQTLFGLVNGDFFDTYDVKTVVLQSVERNLVLRGLNINTDSILKISEIIKVKKTTNSYSNSTFVTNRIFKFPFYVAARKFFPNILFSKIYKWELKESRFSVPSNDFLFWHGDISSIDFNNSSIYIDTLNSVLNNLSDRLDSKGVKLFLLAAPNKYTFYFDIVKKRNASKEPIFFKKFESYEKKYAYLNLYELANQDLEDFYYYDDTHWSPIGSQIVAGKINFLLDN